MQLLTSTFILCLNVNLFISMKLRLIEHLLPTSIHTLDGDEERVDVRWEVGAINLHFIRNEVDPHFLSSFLLTDQPGTSESRLVPG
jgi:hypothetical protein